MLPFPRGQFLPKTFSSALSFLPPSARKLASILKPPQLSSEVSPPPASGAPSHPQESAIVPPYPVSPPRPASNAIILVLVSGVLHPGQAVLVSRNRIFGHLFSRGIDVCEARQFVDFELCSHSRVAQFSPNKSRHLYSQVHSFHHHCACCQPLHLVQSTKYEFSKTPSLDLS